MKRMSGRTKRRCDRALAVPREVPELDEGFAGDFAGERPRLAMDGQVIQTLIINNAGYNLKVIFHADYSSGI
jgi:hypothetical protein